MQHTNRVLLVLHGATFLALRTFQLYKNPRILMEFLILSSENNLQDLKAL